MLFVVCEAKDMSKEKETTSEKFKESFSIKFHAPRNPFKTKNPYKKEK
jgi:hypothetical protein